MIFTDVRIKVPEGMAMYLRPQDQRTELERNALLLMDEAKGRQVAMQMGIQLMGTLGMLLVAYKEKLLSKKEILHVW